MSRPHSRERKERGKTTTKKKKKKKRGREERERERKREKEEKQIWFIDPGDRFPDGGEIGGVKCASCYGWEIKQLIR